MPGMGDNPRHFFQFGIRTLLEIVAVVAVALAFIYSRGADPPPPPAAPAVGRYEMRATDDQGNYYLLFDTATGRCWRRRFDEQWQEIATTPK
jgi:hypothetical protein